MKPAKPFNKSAILLAIFLAGCAGQAIIVPCDSMHRMEADKELFAECLEPWQSQMNAHPDQTGAIWSICTNQLYERDRQCWMTLP
jgi:hypothetical protein